MLMYMLCVFVPCAVFAGPHVVDMTQARHLQTDVDMSRPIEHIFETFKKVHSKQYTNELEEKTRRSIFEVNVNHIKDHNDKYAKGQKSYYLGVNQFSDLTHREFLKLYTGHIRDRNTTNASTYLSPSNVLIPDSVDWRTKGYVTPVKNQGQCGSCWAFSTTGSIEGQHYKKTQTLVSLSEQQLVDCSTSYGNEGCNGGLMDQAFQYVKECGGLESEEDYPYTAEQEDSCRFKVSKERATVTGFVDVPTGKEEKLMEAVATIGPVSIAIDASHQSFQSYAGG